MRLTRLLSLALLFAVLAAPSTHAADIDRTAVDFTPPGRTSIRTIASSW